MEQQAKDLGAQLAQQYGDKVTVEYVDALSNLMDQHPAELGLLESRGVPLPIISVNGQPTFAGGISVEMIAQELKDRGLATAA